jgi:hypothetical protein
MKARRRGCVDRRRRSPRIFAATAGVLQLTTDSLLSSGMAQVLQIDPTVFDDAPKLSSVAQPVAAAQMPVAVVQPVAQPLPVWYLTPVVLIPISAAAFIIGNVLMMIPWSVL